MKAQLAIFASGSGTNAEAIIRHSASQDSYHVSVVVTNKPDAGVIHRAHRLGVPVLVLDKATLESEKIGSMLASLGVSHIVLAGYLKLIPTDLIRQFAGKIINIHPALLPAYGGKGMYGHRVHESVIAEGEKESGITIHEVNEHYDEGRILFQAKCPVMPDDTPDSLAQRIHGLEHQHYPVFLERWTSNTLDPNQ